MSDRIDFVVTWVDGADPAWRAQRDLYAEKCGKKHNEDTDSMTGDQRFRDWGLMRYWFRGIEQHAPWVGKIFFVTWGHVPEWLDTDNPKLQVVRHEDFIPVEYLPTFNSNTITLNLHRIPGLSEKFVYFNDDMFILKDTAPEDFFEKGLPKDEALLEALTLMNPADEFPHILLNNAGVINAHFDKRHVQKKYFGKFFSPVYGKQVIRSFLMFPLKYFSGFRDPHIASPYLKESFEKVWQAEPALLDATCRHHFRSKEDVTEWLVKNWQFCEGHFMPRPHAFGTHLELGADDKAILDAVRHNRYQVVCINDGDHTRGKNWNARKMKRKLVEAFEKALPEKSSFER